jgi:hypothetical protein
MIGEAEVVVGAEIDRFARAFGGRNMDAPALRSGQQPLTLEKAGCLDVAEGRADMGEKGFGHGASFEEAEAASIAARDGRRYCESWM